MALTSVCIAFAFLLVAVLLYTPSHVLCHQPYHAYEEASETATSEFESKTTRIMRAGTSLPASCTLGPKLMDANKDTVGKAAPGTK